MNNEDLDKKILRWNKELKKNNVDYVFKEFQDEIKRNDWTKKDEIHAAMFCLVSINQTAFEETKNANAKYSNNIFMLAKLCCDVITKSWDCKGKNFLASIYHISKYLVSQDKINEACCLSSYAFEFVDKEDGRSLSNEEKQCIQALLSIFLKHVNNMKFLSIETERIYDLWKFLFSPVGFNFKYSYIDTILSVFHSFYSKVILEFSPQCVKFDELILDIVKICELPYLSTDTSERIFIRLCHILEYRLFHCSSVEAKRQVLLEFADKFRTCKNIPDFFYFYINVLLISSGQINLEFNLIQICNAKLEDMFPSKNSFLNDVIYAASAIFIRMRDFLCNEGNKLFFNSVQEFFKLLLQLCLLLKSNAQNKTNSNEVNEKYIKKVDDTVINLVNFVLLLSYSLNPEIINLSNVFTYVIQAEKLCIELIGQQSDDAKKQYFYELICPYCANVARVYRKAELYDMGREIASIVVQNFPFSNELFLTANVQASMLRLVTSLCLCYNYQGLYLESLNTAVVWAVILPNYKNNLISLFVSTKSKLSLESDEMKITSWDLLLGSKYKSNLKIKSLRAPYAFNLLLLELKEYSSQCFKSPEPVLSILDIVKNRYKYEVKIFIEAAKFLTNSPESLEYARRILHDIKSNIDLYFKKYKESIVKKHQENQVKYSCFLGDLYYVEFRIKLLLMRCENESEWISLNSIKPKIFVEPGMEQDDIHDDYNVVPTCCTYVSQKDILSVLDAAVKHWRFATQNVEIFKNCNELFDSLSNMKDAALSYKLYSQFHKEIETWEMIYNVSLQINDQTLLVYALSNLMAMTTWNLNIKWKETVEGLLSKIDENLRLRYQIDYVVRCLINGQNEEIESLLAVISKEEAEIRKNVLLWARYCFVVNKCQFAHVKEATYNPILESFKSYNILLSWIKNCKWTNFWECCEAQCLLFDVTIYMTSHYIHTYRIREAKYYLKDQINLMQKLCLPLRICRCLNAFIRIDTIICSLEECNCKLDSVLKILESENVKIKETVSVPALIKKHKKPVVEVDDNFRFVQSTSPTVSFLMSQMSLSRSRQYEKADFLSHDINHDCTMCQDIEYQLIHCELSYLLSVYNYRCEKSQAAEKYFEGTFSMINYMEDRLNARGYRNMLPVLEELKVCTNMSYADYWALNENYEKAQKYSKEATDNFQKLYYKNCAIELELKDQELCIMYAKIMKIEEQEVQSKLKQVTKSKSRTKNTDVQQDRNLLKTPGSKSTVKIYDDEDQMKISSVICGTVTPFPRKSRRILFDKNNPDFVTPHKPTSRIRGTRSTANKKTELNTPPDIVLDTPSNLEKRTSKLRNIKTKKGICGNRLEI